MIRQQRHIFNTSFSLTLLLLCYVPFSAAAASSVNNNKNNTKYDHNNNIEAHEHVTDVKTASLMIKKQQRQWRQAWKRAFDEIKSVQIKSLESNNNINSSITNTANANANTNTTNAIAPRFDGFANWERKLAQWAEDVREYKALDDNETMSSVLWDSLALDEYLDSRAFDYVDDAVNGDVHGKREMYIPTPVKEGEAVVPETDLSNPDAKLWIVTTAALPWTTGTAVNPLLRAAYLTRTHKNVTLMLPWVERPADQERIYGDRNRFKSPKEQEIFVREWLRDMADMPDAAENLNLKWYIAWQEVAENSLYPMGDLTAQIPQEEVDICILEEPEHLNWYRAPGESWTNKFKHVIGIVHTNYFVYAQEQPAAFIRAPSMRLLSSWMCRAHCHRIIKLSGTIGALGIDKELIENVHGVRGSFLEAGNEVASRLAQNKEDPVFGASADPSVYFIGKMLWSKGIGSLMELMKYAEESADLRVKVDMYGGGPNKDEARERAQLLGLKMPFHGPIDHAALAGTHKIFINPSTSEVLCTTVAEALAMGKFVVLPNHPSNDFFVQFPNCLPYSSKEEFVGNLYYALTHEPEPMTKEASYALTWEAATKRFIAAGSIPVVEAEARNQTYHDEAATVEIALPPIISDEKRVKEISRSLSKTRKRYRQFRSRLAQEIRQSSVLPTKLQQRVLRDLEKRLDLDLDKLLSEPTLRLQLSPAELDKRLLSFYEEICKGPRGDILRFIGGGANVGAQDRYLKQQARKKRREEGGMSNNQIKWSAVPKVSGSFESIEKLSPTLRIKEVLERTLPDERRLESHEKIDIVGDITIGSESSSTSTKLGVFMPNYQSRSKTFQPRWNPPRIRNPPKNIYRMRMKVYLV